MTCPCGQPAPPADGGRIALCRDCAFAIVPRPGLGFGGVTIRPGTRAADALARWQARMNERSNDAR